MPAEPCGVIQALDLAVIGIQSPAARQFLGTDSISIRNSHTSYVPGGVVPVLKMRIPTEEDCRDVMERILNLHGDRKPEGIKKIRGVLVTELEDAVCWIHTASGGYKFTVTREAMIKPTEMKDFREAVQTCLAHIAENRLVELSPGEQLDVLTVSGVHNVLTIVQSPEEPEQEFLSDYYVSFGRRFKGVPVVGSDLTLRIEGDGEVVMVNSNWRQITGEEDEVKITKKSLTDLILSSARFQKKYEKRKIRPEEIHITKIRAGYFEAPFSYMQRRLRPGCMVSFYVGKARDEMDEQLLLSLEEDGNPDEIPDIRNSEE